MRGYLSFIFALPVILILAFNDANAVQPSLTKEIDAKVTQLVNAKLTKTENELEKDLQQYCSTDLVNSADSVNAK